MHAQHTRVLIGTLLATILIATLGGCVIEFVPVDDGTTDPATTITVRIINNTNLPLDPQLYLGSPDGGVEGLFVAENKRTDFGVGTLGIMLARSDTSFTVDCGELGLIGTLGGIFGDDLQNPLGSGHQVVLQENVNVNCGDVVTFAFNAQGSTLITSYAVTLQGE